MDPRITSYLEKNREWAESSTYIKPVLFKEMQKKGREREDGTVIIIACTDPRCPIEEALGIDSSSRATIIRVAGGRVSKAMSSLHVLSAVGNNGSKGVIMVVHHTDCGLMYHENGEIAKILGENVVSNEERKDLEGMDFGAFKDPAVSVKEDVKILKNSPLFKGMQILGFVQDTETGTLTKVTDT